MTRRKIYGMDAVEVEDASGEIVLYLFAEQLAAPGHRRWSLRKPQGEYHCVTTGSVWPLGLHLPRLEVSRQMEARRRRCGVQVHAGRESGDRTASGGAYDRHGKR
jgi:hypothetical protein